MLITESQLKSIIRKILLKEAGGGPASAKINYQGISPDSQRQVHMSSGNLPSPDDLFHEEEEVEHFYDNLLEVLDVCMNNYSNIWNQDIVHKEAQSILQNFNPAGSTKGFDNWWGKVTKGQIKYKTNYPLEIIFSNITGVDAIQRGEGSIKSLLMGNKKDRSIHEQIAKRLYKTLLLRKKNKKQ